MSKLPESVLLPLLRLAPLRLVALRLVIVHCSPPAGIRSPGRRKSIYRRPIIPRDVPSCLGGVGCLFGPERTGPAAHCFTSPSRRAGLLISRASRAIARLRGRASRCRVRASRPASRWCPRFPYESRALGGLLALRPPSWRSCRRGAPARGRCLRATARLRSRSRERPLFRDRRRAARRGHAYSDSRSATPRTPLRRRLPAVPPRCRRLARVGARRARRPPPRPDSPLRGPGAPSTLRSPRAAAPGRARGTQPSCPRSAPWEKSHERHEASRRKGPLSASPARRRTRGCGGPVRPRPPKPSPRARFPLASWEPRDARPRCGGRSARPRVAARSARRGHRRGPLGPAVLNGVAERARDRQQTVQVEVDPSAGLLRHLVLDRQVEIVGAVVEGPERVLVLRQHRGANVRDVVEEDPRKRDVPPVFTRRDLAAAERGSVRLVGPAEEREQAAGLVLEVARPLQVLEALVERLVEADHHRRRRLHAALDDRALRLEVVADGVLPLCVPLSEILGQDLAAAAGNPVHAGVAEARRCLGVAEPG